MRPTPFACVWDTRTGELIARVDLDEARSSFFCVTSLCDFRKNRKYKELLESHIQGPPEGVY